MYKIAFCCILVLASAYAQNDLVDCAAPGSQPTPIYDQEVRKSGSFLKYQDDTLRIPASGFAPGPITCIDVINLLGANGGYPSIYAGGIGELYVILRFKSQLSKGYDFKVSIYY